eukprot:IDg5895t1
MADEIRLGRSEKLEDMTGTEKPGTRYMNAVTVFAVQEVSVPVEVGVFLSRRITRDVTSEPMTSLHYMHALILESSTELY